MITDAPWYVPNMVLRQDLQITSVKEEIRWFSTQYRDPLYTHPNNLTVLTVPPDHRRLRHLPIDLPPPDFMCKCSFSYVVCIYYCIVVIMYF
jgi:hypothetical protein